VLCQAGLCACSARTYKLLVPLPVWRFGWIDVWSAQLVFGAWVEGGSQVRSACVSVLPLEQKVNPDANDWQSWGLYFQPCAHQALTVGWRDTKAALAQGMPKRACAAASACLRRMRLLTSASYIVAHTLRAFAANSGSRQAKHFSSAMSTPSARLARAMEQQCGDMTSSSGITMNRVVGTGDSFPQAFDGVAAPAAADHPQHRTPATITGPAALSPHLPPATVTNSELSAAREGGYMTGVTTKPTGHGFKRTFYKRHLPSPPSIAFASPEGRRWARAS
jgi:hypothetical protein